MGGGPKAPFAGYITKGDHNAVIDQMAGQTLGMANISYFDQHRDEVMRVGRDVYLTRTPACSFTDRERDICGRRIAT